MLAWLVHLNEKTSKADTPDKSVLQLIRTRVPKLNSNFEIGTGTGNFQENVGGKPQEIVGGKFVIGS